VTSKNFAKAKKSLSRQTPKTPSSQGKRYYLILALLHLLGPHLHSLCSLEQGKAFPYMGEIQVALYARPRPHILAPSVALDAHKTF